MAKRKLEERDRRARVAQMQAEQRRVERRRNLIVIGSAVLVGLALIAAAVVPSVRQARRQAAADAAAKQPIAGVQDYPNLTRNHVASNVSYPQTPAVGGDHAPVWVNCGTYAQPVQQAQAVHSLEHGAVWISYRPGLAQDQVQALTDLAKRNSYLLLSPVDNAPAAVIATAWGKQLTLDNASDPRLAAFVKAYQQGPQTPEPGAACTGGAGTP